MIPFVLVVPGALIGAMLWLVWRPLGMWVFLGGTAVFLFWVVSGNREARRRVVAARSILSRHLEEDEVDLVERFPTFFLFPMTSRGISSSLSGLMLISGVLGIVLLFQRRWFEVLILALIYLVAGPLSAAFNPSFFMRQRGFMGALAAEKVDELLRFVQLELPKKLQEQK